MVQKILERLLVVGLAVMVISPVFMISCDDDNYGTVQELYESFGVEKSEEKIRTRYYDWDPDLFGSDFIWQPSSICDDDETYCI